jgi:type II secretory pathway component PulK
VKSTRNKSRKRRRGAGLVIALVTLLVVMSLMGSIIQSLLAEFRQTRQAATELQANYLADAALSRGIAQFRANPEYEGETWRPEIGGVAAIQITRSTADEDKATLTVAARFPDHPSRRVVAERTRLISQSNRNSTAGNAQEETAP